MNTKGDFDISLGILVILITIGVVIAFIVVWQAGALKNFTSTVNSLKAIFS